MIHELPARHDAFDKALHSSAPLHVICQVRNERQVTDRCAATEGVAEQFAGESPMEFRLLASKEIVQFFVANNFLSVTEHAGIFDRLLITIQIPPTSERIKILQRESESVESRVAIVTRRISTVSFQPLPNREPIRHDFVSRN
jgi:hypothetical protein